MEVSIKSFREIGKHDAGIAGGKGASLGEMTQAGIPVPPGYVVLASTFERFLEETDLNVEIDAILSTVNNEEMHTVEHASERIQALILAAKMPEDIGTSIETHFRELGAEFVAVRSSATAEDSASAAWAGQLDTYLNTTHTTLLENVQRCWASLFTPRAIFYRFEKGLHGTKISVAVVVQKMVVSEQSGIAFSVHPVTEDHNQLIIEAGYGLGEAIVSGQVTPDSYVVTKNPREIIDRNVATKDRGLYRKQGGGNEWQDIPREKQEQQALSDEQVQALAETVIRIENHYGFPCDIEWAMEAGELYITQSRPITTLSSEAPVANPEWEVVAKDFHSPLFRNQIWVSAWKRFAEQFETPPIRLGIVSERDEIRYIAIPADWQAAHEFVKKKALDDSSFVERAIDATNDFGEEFNEWSEQHLHEADLRSRSNAELSALLDTFAEKQAQMYAYGFVAPILDFGGFSFVEGNLERFLKSKVASEDYQKYYEVFTAPAHPSFAQDQEDDLMRLMEKHARDLDAIVKLDAENVREKFPEFHADLVQHTKKHAWVYYVYAGPAFTAEGFLAFIADYHAKGIDPKERLTVAEAQRKETDRLRGAYIRELAPGEFDEFILRLAGKMVWAKPRRKDYQSRSYYHSEKLFSEIGSRIGLTLDEARSMPFTLLKSALSGGGADKGLAKQIFELHACVPADGGVSILAGEDARAFVELQLKPEHAQEASAATELKGMTARRGFARGTVRIINKYEDMEKMREGDILVSIATTPSVVPAMKKAAAIVTDEGGLTCHASIVSRELGIPCVVGLKIATQVLKDGDTVEVDADKGIVRKISAEGTGEAEPFPHAWDEGYWHQLGRWVQKPLPSSFWMGYLDTDSMRELYPGYRFNTAFDVNGYYHVAKVDLTYMTDDIVKCSKDGTLAAFDAAFDTKGEGFAREYRKLFDTDAVDTSSFKELFALHERMVGFWYASTLIGDSVMEAVKRLGSSENEAAFFDAVHPHLRKTWIEDEEALVRKIAAGADAAGLTVLDADGLSALPEKHPELGALLAEYRKVFAWVGINKWESEPNSPEKLAARISEAMANIRAGNYVEAHATSKGTADPIIMLAVNAAHWRAACAGLAEEFAYRLRARMTALGERHGLSYEDCLHFSFKELASFEEHDALPVSAEELKAREKGFVNFMGTGGITLSSAGHEPYEELKRRYAHPPTSDSEELTGTTARKGKVTGKVAIVAGNADFKKFSDGDILVAPETTPAFVPLMRKASAILTERGGITSHAAIVSRELGKPCIISIAGLLSRLKDGDMVEVDADNGIVRKI